MLLLSSTSITQTLNKFSRKNSILESGSPHARSCPLNTRIHCIQQQRGRSSTPSPNPAAHTELTSDSSSSVPRSSMNRRSLYSTSCTVIFNPAPSYVVYLAIYWLRADKNPSPLQQTMLMRVGNSLEVDGWAI